MATNLVFRGDDAENEFWTLAATTAPGVPIVSDFGQPAVTITATGNYVTTRTEGPYTISGIPRGGASLEPLEASIAPNGTWDFAVVGGSDATVQNTPVFFDPLTDALTLTSLDNLPYGKVNYVKGYVHSGTVLPVKIGIFA